MIDRKAWLGVLGMLLLLGGCSDSKSGAERSLGAMDNAAGTGGAAEACRSAIQRARRAPRA
jgi:hypothetical protein